MNERVCSAKRCTEIIELNKLMCGFHWKLVPDILKDRLIESYTPGQFQNLKLRSPRWDRLILDAKRLVAMEEKKLRSMSG